MRAARPRSRSACRCALTGPAGEIGAADAPRRRVLGEAASTPKAVCSGGRSRSSPGYRRRSRHLRAQGAGSGGARRLPAAVRHDAVVRGARGGAETRRMERDLHVVRQRRRTADRFFVRAELLPRQYLRPDGDAGDLAVAAQGRVQELLCAWHGLRLGTQQHRRVRGRGEEGGEELRRRRFIRRSARRTFPPTSRRSASPARMPASWCCKATTTTRSCHRRTNTGWATRCSC